MSKGWELELLLSPGEASMDGAGAAWRVVSVMFLHRVSWTWERGVTLFLGCASTAHPLGIAPLPTRAGGAGLGEVHEISC